MKYILKIPEKQIKEIAEKCFGHHTSPEKYVSGMLEKGKMTITKLAGIFITVYKEINPNLFIPKGESTEIAEKCFSRHDSPEYFVAGLLKERRAGQKPGFMITDLADIFITIYRASNPEVVTHKI